MLNGKGALSFFCIFLLFLGGIVPAQNRRRQKQTVDDEYRLHAARLAASMDIKKLAAQVLLTAVEGKDTVPERTKKLLAEIPAGGIILFRSNISSDSERTCIFIEELSRCIADVSLPPFIATDQEGGAVQRFRGKAVLPHPLSYWENISETARQNPVAAGVVFSAIEQDAAGAGRELRRQGVTLNLAPVAEVLTKENQAFLKRRSYGHDPVFVVRAAAAFIRGMDSAGVAATLKHFPGNSAADPHRNKSVLPVSGAELEKLIEPFGELVRNVSPAVVMLSHVVVPSWDAKPSSLSSTVVRRLRGMGFNGIILADDFSMAAAGSPLEVCVVEALAAGVDMIIAWPRDVRKIYQAILSALEAGTLSERRIREAAERIIYQKIRYGLIR